MAKINHMNVLRRYRLKLNQPIDAFARRLGIAVPTLRSFENGWRRITPERAVQIEKALKGGLSREELLPEFFKKSA